MAVKTKRQLRTKSNVALACLATTDLVVGLVAQPFQIASLQIIIFQGEPETYCSLDKITIGTTGRCVWASLYHLLLMSAERYLAVKHPFVHENHVTEARIIVVSGLAWAAAIILPTQDLWLAERQFMKMLAPIFIMFVFFPAMFYFNVTVYGEVRHKLLLTIEAKDKILKNKKAFYTTTIVLLVFFCVISHWLSVSFCFCP